MTGSALPLLPTADLNHMFTAISTSDWNYFKEKRFFITGGSGFIGKWMLSSLLDADKRLSLGCEVQVLTRSPKKFTEAMPHIARAKNLSLLGGDVRNFEFPTSKFDIIVHGATDVVAQNTPTETFSTCVEGTRHMLDFARVCNAQDFLLTSSGAIYGRHPPTEGLVTEDYYGGPDPTQPTSAYGEGKRVSEWLACTEAAETGLKVKIARIYAQIGPYLPLDKHFAIGNFINDVLADRDIVIRGDGTPYRSYLHAADTTACLWAMIIRGAIGRAWNVGSDDGISIANLAERVASLLGSKKQIQIMKKANATQLIEKYVPNVSRANSELKLPPPISMDDAIVRTAEWISSNNMVKR